MSGITFRQILSSINRFEVIYVEDEFCRRRPHITTTPFEALTEGIFTEEQLDQKYDYIRTIDGHITIGFSIETWEEYFK